MQEFGNLEEYYPLCIILGELCEGYVDGANDIVQTGRINPEGPTRLRNILLNHNRNFIEPQSFLYASSFYSKIPHCSDRKRKI